MVNQLLAIAESSKGSHSAWAITHDEMPRKDSSSVWLSVLSYKFGSETKLKDVWFWELCILAAKSLGQWKCKKPQREQAHVLEQCLQHTHPVLFAWWSVHQCSQILNRETPFTCGLLPSSEIGPWKLILVVQINLDLIVQLTGLKFWVKFRQKLKIRSNGNMKV